MEIKVRTLLLITFNVMFTLFTILIISEVIRIITPYPEFIMALITWLGTLLALLDYDALTNPSLVVNYECHGDRVYILVKNKEGRRTATNAKVLITIKKLEDGKEVDLSKNDLVYTQNQLVSFENPKVEGEPIPWARSETPDFRGLKGMRYKHIANIAPGEVNRAVLLDRTSGAIKIFSEYGTEKEAVKVVPSVREEVLLVRCRLKPGRYRVRVTAVADRAEPSTMVLEIHGSEVKPI